MCIVRGRYGELSDSTQLTWMSENSFNHRWMTQVNVPAFSATILQDLRQPGAYGICDTESWYSLDALNSTA